MRVAAVLAALVVIAGCTAPVAPDGRAGISPDSSDSSGAAVPPGSALTTVRTPEGVLGREGGVRFDADIGVDQSDGLSEEELDAYVARTMARVELVRGLEFTRNVTVDVVSRPDHRRQYDVGPDDRRNHWRNQVWEALFVTGEDADVGEAFAKLYASRVSGYYSPGSDHVVVVSGGDRRAADNATLAHELTHALQDQHFDLRRPSLSTRTWDADLAAKALTEGEARYVQLRYVERCGRDWDCVSTPPDARIGEAEGINRGVYLATLLPYSDGPAWVHRLVDDGGWDAVAAAYDRPPQSTEQVVHPGAEAPAPLSVNDTARDGWHRFRRGADGAQTVGEATIAVMLWHQRERYGIDAGVAADAIRDADGPYDTYNYSGRASAGWANDTLIPYRNGDRFGYVWATAWDTERDAREFHDAYRRVLRGHGAERRAANAWVIPNGSYTDAFRVVRDGRRVVVVNAPTVAALDDVRPDLADGVVANGSATDNESADPDRPERRAGAVGRRSDGFLTRPF